MPPPTGAAPGPDPFGGFALVGTALQRDKGIEDSPELAYRDLMAWGEDADTGWVKRYAEESASAVYDWLTALGVQFKIAVHDREWVRAMRVGEQIIQEFPNTKMCDEVRGMIDLLRERAAGQSAAGSGL